MIKNVLNALLLTLGFIIILAIGTALAARLFNINLKPYTDEIAYLMSSGRLINIEEVFDSGGDSNQRVCRVERVDTDGDGFREWVVYYQFDAVSPKNWKQPCPDRSPRSISIYDVDRGNPAVIFPYNLKAPDRDYLGENNVILQQYEIVENIVAGPPATGNVASIPELLVYGVGAGTYNQLTIFKYQYNTETWESPTNMPGRYILIGSFSGNGGVSFDGETKEVVVKDRGPFERSQLAVETVYKLHGEEGRQTYMKEFGSSELPLPIRSTIDFAHYPPADILNTEYPEKIVLAFYQSLDPGYERSWGDAGEFMANGSQAAAEYNNDNLPYFGFVNRSRAVSGLAVVALQYFPLVEKVDAVASIEGSQPQHGWVEVAIAAQQDGASVTPELIRFEMIRQKGQWKIASRTAYPSDSGGTSASSSAVQTSTPPPTEGIPPTAVVEVLLRSKDGKIFKFNGSKSTDPDGYIVNYQWDFGDGNTGAGIEISHTYAQVGNYTVKLTVTDNNGQKNATTVNIP